MSGKIGGFASLAYVPMFSSQPLDQLTELLAKVQGNQEVAEKLNSSQLMNAGFVKKLAGNSLYL